MYKLIALLFQSGEPNGEAVDKNKWNNTDINVGPTFNS